MANNSLASSSPSTNSPSPLFLLFFHFLLAHNSSVRPHHHFGALANSSNISTMTAALMDVDSGEFDGNDLLTEMPANDCFFHPSAENYFMIFLFSIIFCLSVIGNSIVVVVILHQRSMRSVTNLYLLNLALSDLLLSVVCMPPTLVSSLLYCWVFGDFLCKLLAYLQPVVVTASAYTLAAIALERYYAICRPLHSRVWHTRTHAMFVISLVWFVSVIANVFMLFMYEERTYNVNGLNCSPKFEPIVHFGYQIYMTIVLLLIPLFTMTFLYNGVIRTLRSGIKMDIAALELLENDKSGATEKIGNGRKVPVWKQTSSATTATNGGGGGGEQSIRSTHSGQSAVVKQRLIRMLIVIVVIFFCCWTPSYIWWLLLMAQDTFGTFNIWNSKLNTLITVLTYLSSCTNPITYCFLNNKFRNALFLTFGCLSDQSSQRSNLQRTAYNQIQHSQIVIGAATAGTPPRDEHGSVESDPNNNHKGGNNLAKREGNDKKEQNCCLQMLRKTILNRRNKNGTNKQGS